MQLPSPVFCLPPRQPSLVLLLLLLSSFQTDCTQTITYNTYLDILTQTCIRDLFQNFPSHLQN